MFTELQIRQFKANDQFVQDNIEDFASYFFGEEEAKDVEEGYIEYRLSYNGDYVLITKNWVDVDGIDQWQTIYMEYEYFNEWSVMTKENLKKYLKEGEDSE